MYPARSKRKEVKKIKNIKVMDKDGIRRSIKRISHEIIEKNKGAKDLVIVGILKKGAPIAKRIAKNIEEIEGIKVPLLFMDISPYRDDISPAKREKERKAEDIPINGKTVVLVDDVLYTGRTARAAMEAVISLGRPSSIQLAVLIDRGHRELPIRPDYVGKNLPTSKKEYVHVSLTETGEGDSVEIEKEG